MIRVVHPQPGPPIDDLSRFLLADERTPRPNRPWVMTNMVASLDGATAVEGGATGLTGPEDQRLFHAFRSVADVILVGADTVRAERYGPVAVDEDWRAVRKTAGLVETPRLAIASAGLRLDPTAEVFADRSNPPIIFTGRRAPAARRRRLQPVAEVVEAGELVADIGAMMSRLAEDGCGVVLCEGGPTLNGHLVAADVIDEWNLSVSPLLVGGDSARLAHGRSPGSVLAFEIDRVLMGDGMLFARYLRR